MAAHCHEVICVQCIQDQPFMTVLPPNLIRLQVIFLDSDNVAIADVGSLFETPQYARYGALLWPDYWESSAAPDLLSILGLKEAPLGTTESGQMVFDKARSVPYFIVFPSSVLQSGIGKPGYNPAHCGNCLPGV